MRSAEVQATSAIVVQAGAVSPEDRDGQRRHGTAVERCHVQGCDGVPQETGWCAAHQDRAEILRVGACLGYSVLSYASEHATQQGEAAWMQFLRYPQCHRLAELLLLYLREQYPEHFPQGAARFGSTSTDTAGRNAAPAYLCSMRGCGEVPVVLNRDAEEEERTSRPVVCIPPGSLGDEADGNAAGVRVSGGGVFTRAYDV